MLKIENDSGEFGESGKSDEFCESGDSGESCDYCESGDSSESGDSGESGESATFLSYCRHYDFMSA